MNEATQAWCKGRDIPELNPYFGQVRVLHIPEHNHLKLFLEQVSLFRKSVFSCVALSESRTKQDVMRLLGRATTILSTSPNAVFDFVQLRLYLFSELLTLSSKVSHNNMYIC